MGTIVSTVDFWVVLGKAMKIHDKNRRKASKSSLLVRYRYNQGFSRPKQCFQSTRRVDINLKAHGHHRRRTSFGGGTAKSEPHATSDISSNT